MHYEKFADGTVKCIEDEIPFDLPIGWVWTRFRAFCPYGDCEKYETTDIADDSWILDLEDIEKNTGRILAYATKAERNAVSTKHRFYKGQLLYSKLRPYLNKVVIAPKDGYCTSEILPLKLYDRIHPKYIQLFLMSSTFLSYVNMISYGVKMPRLGTEDGRKALIALPPLQEQVRIVEKYECIVPCISELQLSCDELTSSITSIKSKILDLAIRGKLVPQNPEDEPASVLLERIRAEKEELIRQGKIKRDKKESVIFKGEDNSYYEKIGDSISCIDEQLPFEIPTGWVWTNITALTEVFGRIGFRGYTKDDFVAKGEGAISLSPSNISNNEMNYDQCSYITWEKYDESPEIMISNGDILLVKTGSSYGKSTIVRNLPEKATINPQFVVLRHTRISTEYLSVFLQSSYCLQQYDKFVGGTAIPTFSQANLKSMLVAVPPLEEQHRIVKAISKADKVLQSIEKSLS